MLQWKTVENEPAPSILANSGVASAKVKRNISDHQGDAPAMRQPGRGSVDLKLMAEIPEHRASALARLAVEEVARSGVGVGVIAVPRQGRRSHGVVSCCADRPAASCG